MRPTLVAAILAMAACAQWATAANYYVRKSGNDANAGTSAGAAYKTVAKAISVAQAGDVIYVGKGTYSENISTARAGTASAKIRIVGDKTGAYTGDKKGNIVISSTSGTVVSILHDHIEFEQVIITGGSVSLNVNAASTTGIAVRSSTIRYGTNNVITIPAGRLNLSSCTVQGKKNDRAGPVSVSGSGSITATACTFQHLDGGMLLTSSGTSTIERNTFNAIGDTWTLDIAGGNVTVRSNLLRTVAAAGSGIRVQSGVASIWNNTIVSSGTAGLSQVGGTLTFRNNIVSQCTTGLLYSAGSLTASNNLYWLNSSNYTGSAGASGDVLADPRFKNANSNWTLQTGSPAIDAGYAATSIVPLDRQGNARPTATIWDIGAYEVMGPDASVPYACDFEASTTAPSEWTTTTTNTSTALTRFSGPHANNTLGLRLRTTPDTDYTLVFDVYLHNTWDGAHASYGPDRFCVAVDGEQQFAATYSRPAYGFPFDWPDWPELWVSGLYSSVDGVYRRVVVDFTASNTVSMISFYTSAMQGWSDEGWSIDNVRVMTSATSEAYRPRFTEAGRNNGFSQAANAGRLGLVAADLVNNGFQDVVQASTGSSFLSTNTDGGFTSGTLAAASGQAAVFDSNNDGLLDLAWTTTARTEGLTVLRGNGSGTFTAMSTLGTNTVMNGTTAMALADLNNDGYCDIAAFGSTGNYAFVANPNGSVTSSATSAGSSFNGNTPSGAVPASSANSSTSSFVYASTTGVLPNGVADRASGRYVASGDINNDGYTDFFYNGLNGTFFVSDGTGAYTRSTVGVSTSLTAADANGAVLADINNDGVLELISPNCRGSLTCWGRSSVTANFTDQTSARGLSGISNAASVATGDYDNDGDLDLLMKMVSGQVRLYINSGAPAYSFTQNLLEGVSTENAYGDAMFVDVDNDGNLDVAFNSTSTNYPSRLYINSGDYVYGGEADANYLMVRMVGRGAGATNVAGIGARVELWNAANTTLLQRREIGQARGAGGQDPLWVHFGGVNPGQSYTLRFYSGSRSYAAQVIPSATSTTINGTDVPQLYTFSEPASANVRVVRWREVTDDE